MSISLPVPKIADDHNDDQDHAAADDDRASDDRAADHRFDDLGRNRRRSRLRSQSFLPGATPPNKVNFPTSDMM